MARESTPYLNDEVAKMSADNAGEVMVASRTGSPHLAVVSLKNRNRAGYKDALCQLRIGGEKATVNIEDLRTALRHV